ncbi:hypothetical protein [Legionella sp. CNM-4043-24]|uniref:hypothetical protein n=1 Tax=Legionella sp. CNM-4043-24 TaxID=3421646 RepID=UPI00403AD758
MNSPRFFLSVVNEAKVVAVGAASAACYVACSNTLMNMLKHPYAFFWGREAITFMVLFMTALVFYGILGSVVGGIKALILHLCRNNQSQEIPAQLSI